MTEDVAMKEQETVGSTVTDGSKKKPGDVTDKQPTDGKKKTRLSPCGSMFLEYMYKMYVDELSIVRSNWMYKGIIWGKISMVRKAMEKQGWTPEQTFDFFDVPQKYRTMDPSTLHIPMDDPKDLLVKSETTARMFDLINEMHEDEIALMRARGVIRGLADGETEMLRNAMDMHRWTPEQTFEFFGIPKDDRVKYVL